MNTYKEELNRRLWNKDSSYFKAQHEDKEELRKDTFINRLKDFARVSENVLDCGCGNGAILEFIWNKNAKFTGVDISELGIKIAKKRLLKKGVTLKQADLEDLKFKDNSYDLVYCTYVLEHLDNPEKVVSEVARVTQKGGRLIFIAPNYGSPINYSLSEFTKKSPLARAMKRFLKSHLYLFIRPSGLDWEKVTPKFFTEERWETDWDTTVAPYIQTLTYYLESLGVRIVDSSTNIEVSGGDFKKFPPDLIFLKTIRQITEYLGIRSISPFKYYGETLYFVGKKL